MKRHPIIDIVDQLDSDQTRLAIDLLSELLDALAMHLRRIEPVQPSAEWRDPPWLDPPDDTPNQ
ncbi:MAG: hypothetical protein ACNS61_11050 [Candidatus Wenzhouxiangella sp. M2_3B_020]